MVTWGDPRSGGDSSEVQDQLHDVQQIQATSKAFAAIRADGSVVTWGDRRYGGDSRLAQNQLHEVQQIQATESAFAAISADLGCRHRITMSLAKSATKPQAPSLDPEPKALKSLKSGLASFSGPAREILPSSVHPKIRLS